MRTFLLFFCACWAGLLPAHASAGAKAAPAPAGLHISTATPQTVQDVLELFQDIDRQLKGLSAHYAQSVNLTGAGISHEIEGKVDYESPGRLHIEHVKPEPQTIVVDGQFVWIYRKALNQVIQSRLDDLRKSDPTTDNLMALGNYTQLFNKYDVSFDSNTQTVTLRPKDKKAGDLSLGLRLTGAEHFPSETRIKAGQTEILMTLSDIHFNPHIDAKVFRFTPPPGAEVIRDFKMPTLNSEAR